MKKVTKSDLLSGNFKFTPEMVMAMEGILLKTGELIKFDDDTAVGKSKITKEVKEDRDGDWVKFFQDFALICAKKIKSLIVFKVLMWILAKVKYANRLHIRHQDIADDLGIKRQSVTTAMLVLQKLGAVHAIKRGEWEVPWRCFFKGDRVALKVAQDRELDRIKEPNPTEQPLSNMVDCVKDPGEFYESQDRGVCDPAGYAFGY